MDTAERMFAEKGIDAVSLRAINAEAGLSAAALHYHFGTREALVGAILERRIDGVLSQRSVMLKELQRQLRPDIRTIVEALVMPLSDIVLASGEAGVRYLKFVARIYADRSPYLDEIVGESFTLFHPLVERALPQLSSDLIKQRWAIASEITLQTLANIENHVTNRNNRAEIEAFIGVLIDFIAGGLSQ